MYVQDHVEFTGSVNQDLYMTCDDFCVRMMLLKRAVTEDEAKKQWEAALADASKKKVFERG